MFSGYHINMSSCVTKKNLTKFPLAELCFLIFFHYSSLLLEGVEPQSTCELEVDAVAADILNRLDIEGMHTIITMFLMARQVELRALLLPGRLSTT
jgi:hypothetical protein